MSGQTFEIAYAGHTHRVVVTDSGLAREYVWTCDGVEVARRQSLDDRVTLTPKSPPGSEPETGAQSGEIGKIRVRAGFTGVRRATLVIAGTEVDLVPEAGSAAARREERVRAHPRRHVALHTTAALAKVLIPVLGIGLVISWLPSIDLPRIPWPDIDLPSLPWPSIDLPSLPRPDWELPSWVRWVLDKVKYVWPVLLAFGIAQHEVRRRRDQDQRRSENKVEG
ncbi:hypothetical protein [Knoellia sp. LjRoot47]|uniref:hypothetical protein n=1 Tax=Knoellia sp. LjRoot47 TaxID=3342330 RepID=UPI003ECF53AD